MNKEYEALIEASNQEHNAVYDYIEAHGTDEMFQDFIRVKYLAAKLTAERYGFEITKITDDIGHLF